MVSPQTITMRRRISEKKKQEILEMIKENRSLHKISQTLGIGKSSLYYHYRNLNDEGNKGKDYEIFNNEDLGEFLGIFAGDGYANVDEEYHYQVRLFFNEKENAYIDYVESLLMRLFNKRPFRMPRSKYSVVILKYNSKEVFDLLMEFFVWDVKGKGSKSRSIRLIKNIASKSFKIGFLRGCLDSDGYVNENKIEYATASSFLADTIRKFLNELGLPHTYYLRKDKRLNRAPIHIININKTNRMKFFNLIKPMNAPSGKPSSNY
jgi:hypothetical protein